MTVARYEPELRLEAGSPYIEMYKCAAGEFVDYYDYKRLEDIYKELVEKLGELWRAY